MKDFIYADIALLTDSRFEDYTAPEGDWYYGNILHDDKLLQDALKKRGFSTTRIDWSRTGTNWSCFTCAVFRTTWDYFERIIDFYQWLNLAGKHTLLCNDIRLIHWNLDKHYLADLDHSGIPVIASQFIEKGIKPDFKKLLNDFGWKEAVIKPCVSGAARHTYRLNHQNFLEIQKIVHPLLTEESFILQPFIQDVVDTGEDTLIVIDGKVTHAVRKVAKQGDFRVQDDHGGTVHPYTPTDEQVKLAELAINACKPTPVYGRVDMVRGNEGRWEVMELELIEPELWLRNYPPAAEVFADAIIRYIENHQK